MESPLGDCLGSFKRTWKQNEGQGRCVWQRPKATANSVFFYAASRQSEGDAAI